MGHLARQQALNFGPLRPNPPRYFFAPLQLSSFEPYFTFSGINYVNVTNRNYTVRYYTLRLGGTLGGRSRQAAGGLIS